MLLRQTGRLRKAVASLQQAATELPRDGGVRNNGGGILFSCVKRLGDDS
jgi:hypothetical protein